MCSSIEQLDLFLRLSSSSFDSDTGSSIHHQVTTIESLSDGLEDQHGSSSLMWVSLPGFDRDVYYQRREVFSAWHHLGCREVAKS